MSSQAYQSNSSTLLSSGATAQTSFTSTSAASTPQTINVFQLSQDARDPAQFLHLLLSQTHYLYLPDSATTFMEWWQTTSYTVAMTQGKPKHHNPVWQLTSQTSEVWSNYQQVAHWMTGLPKVICISCQAVLDHPNQKDHGTSSMSKHQESC